MAPKNKPVDQARAVPFNDDSYLSVTAEYVVQFEAMIKRVLENPLLSNIQALYAQTIADGGRMPLPSARATSQRAWGVESPTAPCATCSSMI